MAKSKPRKAKKPNSYTSKLNKLNKVLNDDVTPISEKIALADELGLDIADIGAGPSNLATPKDTYE